MPERKDGNKLKKIMNDPSNIVEEMLEGLVKSYPELVHRVESSRVVAKNQKAEQVGLVSGGYVFFERFVRFLLGLLSRIDRSSLLVGDLAGVSCSVSIQCFPLSF